MNIDFAVCDVFRIQEQSLFCIILHMCVHLHNDYDNESVSIEPNELFIMVYSYLNMKLNFLSPIVSSSFAPDLNLFHFISFH